MTNTLNHEELKEDTQRITKNHYIDKHDWEEINYPSKKYDWKNFEKNHQEISLI